LRRPYIQLVRHIRRKLGVALVVDLILSGVVIVLRFSARPAVSLGLLLAALIAVVAVVRYKRRFRVWPRRSDEQR
jgi:hypothetical protein